MTAVPPKRRWASARFDIVQPRNPIPGSGNLISIGQNDPVSLDIRISRSPAQPDSRGGRQISMTLDRAEALALGRHLIGEASKLAVLDGKESDLRFCMDTDGGDKQGLFRVQVFSSTVGGEVVFSVRRFRFADDGVQMDGDIWGLFTWQHARALARGILRLTQV